MDIENIDLSSATNEQLETARQKIGIYFDIAFDRLDKKLMKFLDTLDRILLTEQRNRKS